ncbi:phosphoribosyltransferase family protein [Winogradskyella sp. SYSU M77433]|uniref:phosphoribosyltransferase family protein n=1 Tax=Winogradskyella sp. SYSU M77433 TaxID=3042722 RepID=UPI00248091F6|nr:phosphoribosyltransferase family protein [Winogradskyella sp. SYSU M77433]MDH7914409.1 phosphoribosyltransferase family protein [Winogradskyella sp. SYSU M77433]|tara:strand:- start:419 stop:922 length:504 start_codon:yes stop_codon:yes gene_type:complete
MALTKNTILSHKEIEHKIKRIAYQIYESNVNETELIIAGIDKNGYILAKKIKASLDKISEINSILCRVTVDKEQPTNAVKTSLKKDEYTNKSIVLIDDVLNSGSTLIYGIKHFLDVPLKQFNTAVLVNRNHKKYPVKADFKGISLSTSLFEHVHVNLSKQPYEAYLD